MLSFEILPTPPGAMPEELEIHLDNEGLQSLLTQLKFLEQDRTDHVHLMSESWGGSDLDDEPQNSKGMSIRHVKILLR